MAKVGELDWSHLYEKGHIERPEHPMSKPLNLKKGARGADVVNHFAELAKSIVRDAPPQPTDEQMFGHLVVTEEQAEAAEEKWNNTIKDSLVKAREPIDHLNKPKVDVEWGYGKSFNELLKGKLTEEEMAERNMDVTGD